MRKKEEAEDVKGIVEENPRSEKPESIFIL